MRSRMIGLVVFLAVTAFPASVGETTASHPSGSSIAAPAALVVMDPGGGEGPNIR
jgi:hypothetical protein